jgi:hypothetical protein
MEFPQAVVLVSLIQDYGSESVLLRSANVGPEVANVPKTADQEAAPRAANAILAWQEEQQIEWRRRS